MNTKQVTYPQQDRWSYLWLLIGIVLAMLSFTAYGRWVIPLAAWFANIFILRFMRTQRRIWLAYLILVIANAVYIWFVLPSFLAPLRPSIVVGSALVGALIPTLDRLLVPRLRGFTATLVFPLLATAFEFALATLNPLGSAGMTAYSQYDNLPLLQLVSVTGMLGITFLIAWFASVVNWAWEPDWEWTQIRRGAALYAGILLLVLAYGEARLWLTPAAENTVRVAGVIPVDFRAKQAELMPAIEQDWEGFRRMAQERYPLYFDATIREARAGTKLVLWPEFAAPVAKEDEAALIARGKEVAKQEGIYLAMSMGTIYQDPQTPYEQKILIIDPAGEVVLEHFKYGGVGFEGNRVNGDGVLRTAQTPFGVLSAVICWDTDFPRAVSQAGRNGTDILLSPSLGERGISPLHSYMAILRAIENGVALVRVGDNELSVITDPYGRVLASMDFFTTGERVIVAQVPTGHVFTIYSVIGDLVGWLSVAGLVVMIGLAFWGRRQVTAVSAPPVERPLPV
jgi:apolipoprotein N-acyltransferase